MELEVLVAPVRFNLLSLGRLLDRSWDVSVFRQPSVTFFEYLEEIVLYCYKKNNNLKVF